MPDVAIIKQVKLTEEELRKVFNRQQRNMAREVKLLKNLDHLASQIANREESLSNGSSKAAELAKK